MCEITKRRNVELDVTYELVSIYDPEYFELKQKYEELCKAVLEWDANGYIDDRKQMIKLSYGDKVRIIIKENYLALWIEQIVMFMTLITIN